MGGVAVIGEQVGGWALAGALVCEAPDAAGVRAAWDALDPDVAAVLLTPAAAGHLTDRLDGRPERLVAVIPDA